MNALNNEILKFDEFSFFEEKKIGKEKGGIYIRKGVKYMLKFFDQNQILSEYIGSNLANFILPGRAPQVFLVQDDDKIYIASKFLDNFETLRYYTERGGKLSKITGEEERNVIARFLTHCDEHDENLGVIEKEGNFEAALVDFSYSLSNCKMTLNTLLYSKPVIFGGMPMLNGVIMTPTPKTIGTLQKLLAVKKESWHLLIEQLFANVKSVYADSAYVKTVEESIKKEITDKTNLVKEALYWHSLLQDVNFITPWNLKFCLSPSLDWYIENEILYIVSKSDLLSFSSFLSYIEDHPNPKIWDKALKRALEQDEIKLFEKMIPYIGKSPELIKTKVMLSITLEKIEFFEKMVPYIKQSPELTKYAVDMLYILQDSCISCFDKMMFYMEQPTDNSAEGLVIELNFLGVELNILGAEIIL